MKVTFTKDMMCGKTEIPAAEYMVALASEAREIVLTGGGRTVKISAVKRRGNARSRSESITVVPGGGQNFSLVYQSPKLGEWVSMLEYRSDVKKGL